MKRVILIFLFLLLLAAGAVGYWQFGLPGQKESSEPEPVMSQYLQVPPLVVPVIEEGVAVEQIQLQVELELAGSSSLDEAKEKMPQLVDAMLSQLHGLMAYRQIREESNELPFLKKRLQVAIEDSFDDGELRDVLIKEISRRPLGTGIVD
ncbi:flagellar basal body-associated FliL family protein [Fodinicurvata fenggangensis]|uniref:flagellar basal body-associated FliL family protein n=1 Tax=Fodinicurvata fenggangensis TaxID=1121830 RepID=UPI00047E798A|nr:flagellar basal body-associated FliL family protein [Fodinicurvata fenggangensis]